MADNAVSKLIAAFETIEPIEVVEPIEIVEPIEVVAKDANATIEPVVNKSKMEQIDVIESAIEPVVSTPLSIDSPAFDINAASILGINNAELLQLHNIHMDDRGDGTGECYCGQNHTWIAEISEIYEKHCLMCSCLRMLKQRWDCDAISHWADYRYNAPVFILQCSKSHRFLVNPRKPNNCHVCELLNSDEISDNIRSTSSSICATNKTILSWFCRKCKIPFLSSVEALHKLRGAQNCPHTVKFGGVNANSIISKNIIEAIFSTALDKSGTKFNKNRPTAYHPEIKLAIHYGDPKAEKKNKEIQQICLDEDIDLIYVEHKSWTVPELVRYIVEETDKYIHIPDVEYTIDEIIPGAFMTVPRQSYSQSYGERKKQMQYARFQKRSELNGYGIKYTQRKWRGPELPHSEPKYAPKPKHASKPKQTWKLNNTQYNNANEHRVPPRQYDQSTNYIPAASHWNAAPYAFPDTGNRW